MSVLLDALRKAEDVRRGATPSGPTGSPFNADVLRAENETLRQMLGILIQAAQSGNPDVVDRAFADMEKIATRLKRVTDLN